MRIYDIFLIYKDNKKREGSDNERKKHLEAIKYVDEIIKEENWNQKIVDIKKYNISILAMGDDWKENDNFKNLENYCQVVYLERTKEISSSIIKKSLNDEKNK